jgi:PAS domain S-box-containing protein
VAQAVEDEATGLRNALEALGYDVVGVACSGEETLAMVEERQPDLVLIDIELSGQLDGVDAACDVRTRFDLPVVYVTDRADSASLERAKPTHPFAYLLKPFEHRELRVIIEMALYRHRVELRLRDSRRWLRMLLESMGDAVITTDIRGRILSMNPVAERMTGWTEEEAQGKDSHTVIRILDQSAGAPIPDPVKQAMEGEPVELEQQTFLIARDGREIPVETTTSPIENDYGKLLGLVFILRDVTERREAERILRRYTQELELRNRELDAFAHTVAHDLKSTLAPIIGFAELLEDEHKSLPEEHLEEAVSFIAQGGRKMNSIIENLLMLAEVRKEDVELEPLDMASVVEEALGRLEHVIEKSEARVERPAAWPRVRGYAPWVEELWVNYVSNALKYGGQPLEVVLGYSRDGDGRVRFWVQDRGPGLTVEEQERLFRPFTRLNQVDVEGHGLGLSIVRRIAGKLGGEVGMESEVGAGSTFYFTLPEA